VEAAVLAAVDAVITARPVREVPSAEAAVLAWAGGLAHAAQADAALAVLGTARVTGDGDVARLGSVTRLADPADPRAAGEAEALPERTRPGYLRRMGVFAAAAWGTGGGLAAGLVAVAAAITTAGFRWPWDRETFWPRMVVTVIGLIVGALVAGAAHGQMISPWPAFLLGVGAPSVIRGALSRLEVAEQKAVTSSGLDGDLDLG
jgi:hypothetical protein